MIRTVNPAEQHRVDKANALIEKWYRYVVTHRESNRGQSLRLYISPHTWHDYVSLEFGQLDERNHIALFGRNCQVVFVNEYDHSYLTYDNGC